MPKLVRFFVEFKHVITVFVCMITPVFGAFAVDCPTNATANGSTCQCDSGYTATNHGYTFNNSVKVANKSNYTLIGDGSDYTAPLSGLVSGETVTLYGTVWLSNASSGDPTISSGNKCWCRITGPFETAWQYANSTQSTVSGCVAKCVEKIAGSNYLTKFYTNILMGGEVCEAGSAAPVTITLDWNENGGTSITDGSCVLNGDITLPNATPSKTGYSFAGWQIGN